MVKSSIPTGTTAVVPVGMLLFTIEAIRQLIRSIYSRHDDRGPESEMNEVF